MGKFFGKLSKGKISKVFCCGDCEFLREADEGPLDPNGYCIYATCPSANDRYQRNRTDSICEDFELAKV